MGLKMFHRADDALLNNLTDPEIVAVPAAVMEDGEQALFLLRQGDQLPGLLHIKGKGFVHHHMLAGVQRQAGQRRVRGVGGGDDHQIDIRMLDRRFRGGDHRDVRQVAFDFFFITRGDEGQVQARHRTDKRRVEGLTDEAIANQGDIYRVVTHQVLRVVKRQQYVQRGQGHPPAQARDDRGKDGLCR